MCDQLLFYAARYTNFARCSQDYQYNLIFYKLSASRILVSYTEVLVVLVRLVYQNPHVEI